MDLTALSTTPVLPVLFRTKQTPPESCLYTLSPLPLHLSLSNLLQIGKPDGQFSVPTLMDLAVTSDTGDNTPTYLKHFLHLAPEISYSPDFPPTSLANPPSHSSWLTHSSSLSIIKLLKSSYGSGSGPLFLSGYTFSLADLI